MTPSRPSFPARNTHLTVDQVRLAVGTLAVSLLLFALTVLLIVLWS